MTTSASTERRAMKHVAVHMIGPLLLGIGMALSYLGAFHQPSPHDVKVDVVGTSAQTKVIAQTLQDKLGDAVSIRTVPDQAAAADLIKHRTISAAFVPDPKAPTLMYSDAASSTTSNVIVTIFSAVATSQSLPLHLDDVAPVDPNGDPGGQSMFFYLVGLSVGSYAAGVAIGAAGGVLEMRSRVVVALIASFATTSLVSLIAGPLYGAIPNHRVELWMLGWIYSMTAMLIGTGLHTFLTRWTGVAMSLIFVMLNFTSSGGVFAPALQPGFFGALHSFWIGAAFHEAGRDLVYFPDLGIGRHVLTLVLWFVVACLLVGVAAAYERRGKHSAAPMEDPVEEELEEIVAAD